MAFTPSTILEQRRAQMFPQLTPAQVEVARRFGGTPRRFGPDEVVFTFGDVGAPAWLCRTRCSTQPRTLTRPCSSNASSPAPRRFRITLDDDTSIRASAVVIASGARYRRLGIENLGEFEGEGVYYRPSPLEAKLCATHEVIIVGGRNSAGQAAVYQAAHARHVLLVRGPSLAATMSR